MVGKPEDHPRWPTPVYPPEYRSAIEDEGVEALEAFVAAGGTLVALGDATAFAIEKLELKVRNVIDKLPSEEFFCPGSTVKASFDNSHPLAYGMPDDGLVLFWGSPTFQIKPSQHNEWYQTIVRYGEADLLQSGWLIGEEHIAKKAGMVVAKKGKGRVILIGFRTQNRAQTHGTFKLLLTRCCGDSRRGRRTSERRSVAQTVRGSFRTSSRRLTFLRQTLVGRGCGDSCRAE